MVVALLALTVPVPARAAVCDTKQVEDLTVHVGTAPSRLAAGKQVLVPVTVTRPGDTAAEGVDVLFGLTGKSWGAYDQPVSDSTGFAEAHLVVPKGSRGAATLDVEVVHLVVDLPCLRVEEHGRTTVPWGKAS